MVNKKVCDRGLFKYCGWTDEIPLRPQPGYSDSGTRSKVGVNHSVVTFGLQYNMYMKIDHYRALPCPRPWAVSSSTLTSILKIRRRESCPFFIPLVC
jgi:hypothetical protein